MAARKRTSTGKRRTLAVATVALAGLGVAVPAALAEESPPSVEELLEKCNNGSDSCTFHPEQTEPGIRGERHPVGEPVNACSDRPQQRPMGWTDTQGQSTSLGVEVKAEAKFAEVFTASVSAETRQEWSWGRTFTSTENLNVGPWEKGRIYHTPLYKRVKGTFELHFPDKFHGHYIWYAPFEAVGPAEESLQSVDFVTRPMSPGERAQCPMIPPEDSDVQNSYAPPTALQLEARPGD